MKNVYYILKIFLLYVISVGFHDLSRVLRVPKSKILNDNIYYLFIVVNKNRDCVLTQNKITSTRDKRAFKCLNVSNKHFKGTKVHDFIACLSYLLILMGCYEIIL